MDEQGQNHQNHGAKGGHQDGADGPGLQAGLDVHAGEVGDHVEVGVVQVAGAHGGGPWQPDRG